MGIMDRWMELDAIWRVVSFLVVFFGVTLGLPAAVRYSKDSIKRLRDPKSYWINRLRRATYLKMRVKGEGAPKEKARKKLLASYGKYLTELRQIGVSEEEVCETLLESLGKKSPVHFFRVLDIQILIELDSERYGSMIRHRYIDPLLVGLESGPLQGAKDRLREVEQILALVGDDEVARALSSLLSRMAADATRKFISDFKLQLSEHATESGAAKLSNRPDLISSIEGLAHALSVMKKKCIEGEISALLDTIPKNVSVEHSGVLVSYQPDEIRSPIEELLRELRRA